MERIRTVAIRLSGPYSRAASPTTTVTVPFAGATRRAAARIWAAVQPQYSRSIGRHVRGREAQ